MVKDLFMENSLPQSFIRSPVAGLPEQISHEIPNLSFSQRMHCNNSYFSFIVNQNLNYNPFRLDGLN